MTEFKLGDRVVYTGRASINTQSLIGRNGTVRAAEGWDCVSVDWDGTQVSAARSRGLLAANLALLGQVKPEYKPKIGDRVRVVLEGTARDVRADKFNIGREPGKANTVVPSAAHVVSIEKLADPEPTWTSGDVVQAGRGYTPFLRRSDDTWITSGVGGPGPVAADDAVGHAWLDGSLKILYRGES